jgi:hypothetical protein
MISCAQTQLRTYCSEDCLPKLAREHWITVRYDGLGKAMEFVDIVQENLGHLDSRIGVLPGNEMCKLRKLVHDNKNAIKLTRGRKSIDEIHQGHLPGCRGNRQGLQKSGRKRTLGLSLLANMARANKGVHKLFHANPFEQRNKATIRHRKAKMTTNGAVMEGLDNHVMESRVSPNPDAAFVTQQAISKGKT